MVESKFIFKGLIDYLSEDRHIFTCNIRTIRTLVKNVSHFYYFGITRAASSPWQPLAAGLLKVPQRFPFSNNKTMFGNDFLVRS